MVRMTTIGMAGLALFAVSGTSQADQLDMTFGSIYGQGVHYNYDPDGAGGNAALLNGNTTAGRFDWTVASGGSVVFSGHTFNSGEHFTTFCTELTEFISPGATYTYNSSDVAGMPSSGQLGSPMGAFRAGLIQELFDNHWADAVNGTSTSDRIEAAAFQVAIWEIVYEDRIAEVGSGGGATLSDVLAAGADTFVISQNLAAVTLADTWLDALTGNYGANERLIGFASDPAAESVQQDQLLLVPLPAPVWLAGMGLLGVVAGRKRLRRLAAV